VRPCFSFILLAGLTAAPDGDRPTDASVEPPAKPEAVVQKLRAGMSEGEVRAVMRTVALDSGTVYWGGSGARRLYFELPHSCSG
jgi:hypothetical protein